MVVVTTFLTALSVKMAIHDKYFTHVLLDEAAQVREPEAVAPLCMANLYTKIVVAGDNQQVNIIVTVIMHDLVLLLMVHEFTYTDIHF